MMQVKSSYIHKLEADVKRLRAERDEARRLAVRLWDQSDVMGSNDVPWTSDRIERWRKELG